MALIPRNHFSLPVSFFTSFFLLPFSLLSPFFLSCFVELSQRRIRQYQCPRALINRRTSRQGEEKQARREGKEGHWRVPLKEFINAETTRRWPIKVSVVPFKNRGLTCYRTSVVPRVHRFPRTIIFCFFWLARLSIRSSLCLYEVHFPPGYLLMTSRSVTLSWIGNLFANTLSK